MTKPGKDITHNNIINTITDNIIIQLIQYNTREYQYNNARRVAVLDAPMTEKVHLLSSAHMTTDFTRYASSGGAMEQRQRFMLNFDARNWMPADNTRTDYSPKGRNTVNGQLLAIAVLTQSTEQELPEIRRQFPDRATAPHAQ